MRQLDKRTGRLAEWVRELLAQRHSNVVACALANKLARTAWAIAARNSVFDAGSAASPALAIGYTCALQITQLVLRRLKIDDVNGTVA